MVASAGILRAARKLVVFDDVGRIEVSGLKGGRVVEQGLDRGTRLTARKEAAVVGIVRAATADNCDHGIARVVDDDTGTLQRVLAVLLLFVGAVIERIVDALLELALNVGVYGRVNLIAACANFLALITVELTVLGLILLVLVLVLEGVLELEAVVLHELQRRTVDGVAGLVVLRRRRRDGLRCDFKRFILIFLELFRGNLALFVEAVQDLVSLAERVLRVVDRLITRGAVADAHQDRGLPRLQVLCALVKVVAARGLHAVTAVGVVIAVTVELHDFFFAEFLFELRRKQNFGNLTLERALLREIGVLDDLLGDGGAALGHAAVFHIGDAGAEYGHPVPAVVRVKAPVLLGDVGLFNPGAYVIGAHIDIAMPGADDADLLVVLVEDLRIRHEAEIVLGHVLVGLVGVLLNGLEIREDLEEDKADRSEDEYHEAKQDTLQDADYNMGFLLAFS